MYTERISIIENIRLKFKIYLICKWNNTYINLIIFLYFFYQYKHENKSGFVSFGKRCEL